MEIQSALSLMKVFIRKTGSSIVPESIGTFLLKGSGIILALVQSVLLARVLGADGYGAYAYILALISILSMPVQMGLPNLALREVALFRVKLQWSLLKGFMVRSWQFVIIVSFVTVLVLICIITLVPSVIPHAYHDGLRVAFVLVPIMGSINLCSMSTLGMGDVIGSQLAEAVIKPLLFIGLIGVAYIQPGGLVGPESGIWMNVLASFGALAVAGRYCYRAIRPAVRHMCARFKTRQWALSIGPLAVFSASSALIGQVDLLVLGYYETPDQIGLYRVAFVSSAMLAFGLQVTNTVLAPRYAEYFGSRDHLGLQQLAVRGARVSFTLAMVLAVIYVLIGEEILKFLFGVEFGAAYTLLLVLCIGQLINAAAGSCGLIMTLAGLERQASKVLLVAVFSNVILNILLIPAYGPVGAAIATGVSLSVWNLAMLLMLRMRLNISVSMFGAAN